MNKIPAKLISKLDATTIRFQAAVINRLKLFDFSKSAIIHYSESRKKEYLGYSFDKFQSQFKLVDFKKDSKVKSIEYKEIVRTGNAFIEGELADSSFVLNIATFEHWLLSALKELILFEPREFFPQIDKQINIIHLKKFADIQALWEELADDYLSALPYKGMEVMLKTFLRCFGLKESNFTKDIVGKLNENSQCRNLIVHNQKKVNSTYTKKCGKFAKFAEGEKVVITEGLLFAQADNLLRFMQDFRNNYN